MKTQLRRGVPASGFAGWVRGGLGGAGLPQVMMQAASPTSCHPPACRRARPPLGQPNVRLPEVRRPPPAPVSVLVYVVRPPTARRLSFDSDVHAPCGSRTPPTTRLPGHPPRPSPRAASRAPRPPSTRIALRCAPGASAARRPPPPVATCRLPGDSARARLCDTPTTLLILCRSLLAIGRCPCLPSAAAQGRIRSNSAPKVLHVVVLEHCRGSQRGHSAAESDFLGICECFVAAYRK